MLPALIRIPGAPWPVLPEGLHSADFSEVAAGLAINPWRRTLFDGLLDASRNLRQAGCQRLYLDGSFVTGKPHPRDYDVCWDPSGVDPTLLDPVFLNFENRRAAQKSKYKGEFFPSGWPADRTGTIFIDFFQIERFSGRKKGIVLIELPTEPTIQ